MKITIKFFASLRESLQSSGEVLETPAEVTTVVELKEYLMARGEPWVSVLATGKAVRMALNHQMIEHDAPLQEGAEVAFFPPVTGG